MVIDVRAKGATAETKVRDELRKLTGLKWERTPGSGALDPKHMLKGDLYVPGKDNLYCVEVKHYADDHLTSKVLTSKAPQLLEWWEQAIRQGEQVSREPLLIFKFDRSKLFVAFKDFPNVDYPHMYICVGGHEIYIAMLEDWIKCEQPRFVK
jgi:hypothetical protein